MSPVDLQSAEFNEELAAAGKAFDRSGVAKIYCIHGTFVGNDILGLLTELSRFFPNLSRRLSAGGKRVIDIFTGEAGNYTRQFTTALETALANGAQQKIPVELFNWSSQNNHIARSDGAIRMIAELGDFAERLSSTQPSRVQLWGHSHGGNVMALVSQLLGADRTARDQFFEKAKSFYQPWIGQKCDMPVWQQVRDLLDDEEHPIRQLKIDMVTFGTPIRYGWSSGGYAKLLHFNHHRPPPRGEEHQAPVPLNPLRARKALDGDYIQQIGISGTNFMPLPIALRTLLADWRLDGLLEANLPRENIIARLRHGARVPDEGTTLLVDYTKIARWLHRHIAGHGLYTRRIWLPFHCREIANRFYNASLENASP